MSMPFEPEEIDDLDETLIEAMDDEELEEFRDQLEDTLDELQGQEPDEDDDPYGEDVLLMEEST